MPVPTEPVTLNVEQLADLLRAEIGPVAERDQLPVALLEPLERRLEIESRGDLILDLVRSDRGLGVELLVHAQAAAGKRAAGDSEQPGERRPLARIEAALIAQRSFEGLARHVLGLASRADAVGDVGIDPPDQPLGVRERVAAHPRS